MTLPHEVSPPAPQLTAPPKKSNTLRTVLIIVGVVLVLCCGGAVAGGFALFSTVKNTLGPAREAVDTFITSLESGDTSIAYDQLCASAKGRFDHTTFISGVQAQPRIVNHEITSVEVEKTNGRTTATVVADLTKENGFVDQHEFHLTKEDGDWKICGNPY